MKQLKKTIRKITCLGVLIAQLAFAQAQMSSTATKYVCDNGTNLMLDLGMDVLGKVLNVGGGYWDQVDADDNVIKSKIDNVLVLAGLPIGEYNFIYTATTNECLPAGTKVKATVVILETAKGFSHVVYSCVGDNPTLDLSTIVSPGLPKPTFTSTNAGTLTETVLDMAAHEGAIEVHYNGGQVNGCNDEAVIYINVLRDGSTPELTVENVSYCITSLPSAINLSNLSGISAQNGVWTLTTATSDITMIGNVATFVPQIIPGDYVFTYAWDATSCYAAGTADLTITITSSGLVLPTDPSDDICKSDNPNKRYNLALEGLGISLPNSAGIWAETSKPSGASSIDVTQGMFDVASAIPGVYAYKYTAHSMIDMCGLSGSSTLTLTVGDLTDDGGRDGRLQLCSFDIESRTGNLKLSNYIMDMPAGAVWTSTSGATIQNDDEVAFTELSGLGLGIHVFSYTYTSEGCAGEGGGTLYISTTSKLEIPETVMMSFCRPEMSSVIDLNQVIGADLAGTWSIDATSPDNTATLTGSKFSETVAVGDGSKEYVLVFTSTGDRSCGEPEKITVTIKVNDDQY